jgi:hypothetical protein
MVDHTTTPCVGAAGISKPAFVENLPTHGDREPRSTTGSCAAARLGCPAIFLQRIVGYPSPDDLARSRPIFGAEQTAPHKFEVYPRKIVGTA